MSLHGIKISEQQLCLISKALADPKRFEMLQQIGASENAPTCSCLRESTGLAAATVSHHLKELESAGLIQIERIGKFAHISFRRDVWNAYLKQLSTL